MLELFVIRNQKTNKVLPGFFANKEAAKVLRDKYNQENNTTDYVVSPGKDHFKFKQ